MAEEAKQPGALEGGGQQVTELLLAKEIAETEKGNKTLRRIATYFLLVLGLAVSVLVGLLFIPLITAMAEVKSPAWGYVAQRVDAAVKTGHVDTFPYRGWQFALALAGPFPGTYSNIFFGTGPRGQLPLIILYSCLTPAYAQYSANPELFAQFLSKLYTSIVENTPLATTDISIMCEAWKNIANVPEGTVCQVPPKPGSDKCSAQSIAGAGAGPAVGGALAGAMAGAMIGTELGPIGWVGGAIIGGLLSWGAASATKAAQGNCM